MSRAKAIVIGSGVAGMAVAIRLAVQGFETTVFEKNNYPGGKLTAFAEEGFFFDLGPSLFVEPDNLKEIFSYAGEHIEDFIQWRKCTTACNYFFENGKTLSAPADREMLANAMHQAFGEDKSLVVKYLTRSEKLYNSLGDIFLNKSLHRRSTWLSGDIINGVKNIRLPYLFSSLHSYNTSAFRSPEARQLFNRYATYNGSNPYKAPAMLSLIPHLEFNNGVYYPQGGMISINNALYNLALKKGVKFCFDEPVLHINLSGKKVKSVTTKNGSFGADVVVSNSDVYATYQHLLGDTQRAKKVLRQERSSSALVFFWGINGMFPELDLHNIFFSSDYKKEFEDIFKNGCVNDDPTIYINITGKYDPGHAPIGKENWFVMINAPRNIGQDWNTFQAMAKQRILEKLKRILKKDIGELVVYERILTPATIEQNTASYMGSLYGTSSNSRMAAFLRHANFSNNIKGLYFCGGSVHPGGGIPLCFKSAKITAEIINGGYNKNA